MSDYGFVCGTCGLSDYGRRRMALNGFHPRPCQFCQEHFAMAHPHMPDPIPDVPEHVVPTAPDEIEERLGMIYCVRCGMPITKIETGEPMPGRDRPCVRVDVALRAIWDTGAAIFDETPGTLFDEPDDRGFTVIELLCVLVIVGILFAVSMYAIKLSGPDVDATDRVEQCIERGGTPFYTTDRWGDIARYLGCGE